MKNKLYMLIETTLNSSLDYIEYENTLKVTPKHTVETNIIGYYTKIVDVESKLTEIGFSNFSIICIFNGYGQVIYEEDDEKHYKLEVLNTEELNNGTSTL